MSVIDTVTFRLATGADRGAFLVDDKRVQTECAPTHPGFWRRTTAEGADGEWIVVTLWRSADDADASAQRAADHPATTAFLAHIDASTLSRRRYTTLD